MATLASALVATASASAGWPAGGKYEECHKREGAHCYSLSEHNVKALASIAYIKDQSAKVSEWESGAFIDHEQWISFGKENEWVETGDTSGEFFSCCNPHPFFAEQQKGTYKQELSPGIVPGGVYNHYIIYDSEHNGRWHIYWNCCEVGAYGGGWPEKLSRQEAGVEAYSEVEPGSDERQEVAWSEGGEWYPWTGATWYHSPGLCIKSNPESSAAGNIEGGTKLGATEAGVSCS
jgi:hypothetical protein